MEVNHRMNSPETERITWFESDATGGSTEFDYELSSTENKNTKRKTETDMKIFSSFLLTMNEMRSAETLGPKELDKYLTTFFSVIKKHDGNDYEPASLRGMLCSIERHLRARDYPKSLTRDIIFINTRNTLKDRQLVLRELAKNAKKGKQEMLTLSSIEKLKQLYNAKEFGPYSPMAVINSLCFAFVVHLKIRKAIDHKQLLWGDIVLKSQDSREYLCYEPVPGRDYLRQRLNNISHYRIYAQSECGSPADPVAVYKLYASKRPSQAITPDSPFYLGLAVNCQTTEHQPQWFKSSPMGVNKLNDLVRMIREITGNLAAPVSGNINCLIDNHGVGHMVMSTEPTCKPNCCVQNQHEAKFGDGALVPGQNDPMTTFDGQKVLESAYTTSEICRKENRKEPNVTGNEMETDIRDEYIDDIGDETENADHDIGKTDTRNDKQERTKEDISAMLNMLEESEKREIVNWFRESYIVSSDEQECRKCDTPRRFSINFTWKPTDNEVVADVQTTPLESIQNNTSFENTHEYRTQVSAASVPVSDESNGMVTTSQSTEGGMRPHGMSNASFDKVSRVSDTKNRPVCVTNALVLPYKRSMSEESSRESKVGRYREVSGTGTPTNDCNMSTHEQDRDEHRVSDADVTTDHNSTQAKEPTVAGPVFPDKSKPWFAPWAFDPRLAMYLRHGFVPMYGECATNMGNINGTGV